jgi:hypothetical protein
MYNQGRKQEKKKKKKKKTREIQNEQGGSRSTIVKSVIHTYFSVT